MALGRSGPPTQHVYAPIATASGQGLILLGSSGCERQIAGRSRVQLAFCLEHDRGCLYELAAASPAPIGGGALQRMPGFTPSKNSS
jgi:hypothetical protein